MKPVAIQDLIPETGTFTLSKFPGVEFHLRPISMSDTAWLVNKCGSQQALLKAFEEHDMKLISTFIFRLIDRKDLFEAVTEVAYDDNGVCLGEVLVTGGELINRAVHGTKESIGIMNALLKTMGVSNPMPDQIEASQGKKKTKKKSATRK